MADVGRVRAPRHTDAPGAGGYGSGQHAAGLTLPQVKALPKDQPLPETGFKPAPITLQNPQYDKFTTGLNPAQQAQFQAEQHKLLQVQHEKRANDIRLQGLANLKTQGPQGVRVLQSTLNAKGYKVSTDGAYGPQTDTALRQYIRDSQAEHNTKEAKQFIAAHPLTIRGKANARLDNATVNVFQAGLPSTKLTIQQARGYVRDELNKIADTIATSIEVADAGEKADLRKQVADLRNAALSALDPAKMDNSDVADTLKRLNEQYEARDKAGQAAAAKGDHGNVFGAVLTDGGLLVSTLLAPLSLASDWAYHSVAAGFQGMDGPGGGGLLTGVQATLGSLTHFIRIPGTNVGIGSTIAPAGSSAAKDIQATNTNKEVAARIKAGDIPSLGNVITGTRTWEFMEKHPHDKPLLSLGPQTGYKLDTGHDWTVKVADFVGRAAIDPTVWAGNSLAEFKLVGEVAGESALKGLSAAEIEAAGGRETVMTAGRAYMLEATARGRALVTQAETTLSDFARTGTVKGIMATFKVDAETAARIIAAGEDATGETADAVAARLRALKDAFATGQWNPSIRLYKQLAIGISDRVGLGAGLDVGRGAIAATDRLEWLRRLASAGPVASTYETNAMRVVDDSLSTITTIANRTLRTSWDEFVSKAVSGLSNLDRFWRLAGKVEEFGNPDLSAAFEGNFRQFLSNPKALQHVAIGTYMETLFSQKGFEDVLKRMEVLVAAAEGDLGGAAKSQLETDLKRMLVGKPSQVVRTAASDLGLSLPSAGKTTRKDLVDLINKVASPELQAHFKERLAALGAKGKGLNTLARDVKFVEANAKLRKEVEDALAQVAERGGVLEKKAGLFQAVGRKAARAVLSTTDVVAPSEIRWQYKTANDALHTQLRGIAVARFLDGFYLSTEARTAFIRAAEAVQTEDDLYRLTDRMVRAAMDAHGIENPEAVLDIIKNEMGAFKVLKPGRLPLRSVDEEGKAVTDLQTLAQRMESVRVPSPVELNAAIRKAILDGAESASAARRLDAFMHVKVFEASGNIGLHFRDAAGNEVKKYTIATSLKAGHKLWKFLIVTNAGLPLVGAAAGFIGSHGNIMDRFRGAGLGFAGGFSTRFIFRVAGIEDRLRISMADGFTPEALIPGYARMTARRYGTDPLRRFVSDDEVRLGNHGVTNFENDILIHTDPDWEIIDNSHARAPIAWERIANHQLSPESNPVDAILLRERAGHGAGPEIVTEGTTAADKAAQPASLDIIGKSDFQAQMDDLAQQVLDEPQAAVHATNEQLLEDHPYAPTKRYYRGEPADVPTTNPRGANWSETYAYAQKFARKAGEDGNIYYVDLPMSGVGENAVPLVGRAGRETGDVGWVLEGTHTPWADAAEQLIPDKGVGLDATRMLTAREAADKALNEFFATDEGKLWMKRFSGAKGGTGRIKVAVERERAFIERYFTPEMADMRVAGGPEGTPMLIPRDTFKRNIKDGLGPDAFHAQKTWVMPRKFSDLYKDFGKLVNRGVLTGPTNYNRMLWSNAIFNKEYDRLIANGVAREEAQRIADGAAVQRVNSIMHIFQEPTRFAGHLDYFAPFQHAREDFVRVYTSMAVEDPARTIRAAHYVQQSFNWGKENGIFTKNENTGAWELTIPGSGAVSRALFGTPLDVKFTTNIKDYLFIGEGAYGSNFLPHPGGPYWSAFAASLQEHFPQDFVNKNPVTEFLFGPTGEASGNLLGSNSSRLWMAFTGDTPPWEFASQESWKNQLEMWRQRVGQELTYRARLKDANAPLPTEAEVDDATSKFFRAWSFFGANWAATSYPTLTGKAKYDAAVNAFTAGGVLKFDKAAFIKEYPEFEAYTFSGTEWIGPDDLATMRKFNYGDYPAPLKQFNPATQMWETIPGTDKGKRENTSLEEKLGYRRYKNWDKFRDEIKTYKRTSDYYRELHNAEKHKEPMQREQALVAVNKKYSDLVGKFNKDYQVTKEIAHVNSHYPKGMREAAYQRVRSQYGITNVELLKYETKAKTFEANPWKEARLGSEVAASVESKFHGDTTSLKVLNYIKNLNPAEQARYWQYQMAALGYDKNYDDPNKVLARNAFYKKNYGAVFADNPNLLKHGYNGGAAPVNAAPLGNVRNDHQRYLKEQLQLVLQAHPEIPQNVTLKIVSADEFRKLGGWGAGVEVGAAFGDYRGGKRVIVINNDLVRTQDAKYLSFVIAKELGQATYDKYLNTPDKRAAYMKAQGVTNENQFVNGQKGWTSAESFGVDFATALGYGNGGYKVDRPVLVQAALQEQGILPRARTESYDNPYTKLMGTKNEEVYQNEQAAYDAIARTQEAMNTAYAAKNWKAFDALQTQRDHYYSLVAEARDRYLQNTPDLTKYYDDLHAAHVYSYLGNEKQAAAYQHKADMDKANAPLFEDSEEKRYLKMAPAVQRAYYQSLVDNLDMPAGKTPYDISQYVKATTGVDGHQSGLHKVWWDYLSVFQQEQLEKHYPASVIEGWKYNSEFYLRGAGSHNSGKTPGPIPGDLKFAYALLKKYDRRGTSDTPPSTYAEYLALPAHPGVKAEFLDKHPDLAKWLNKGPFATMPAHYRDMVVHAMVKHGDWHGGPNSYGGGRGFGRSSKYRIIFNRAPATMGHNNLAWAKYQLYAWSRRSGHEKPATYDLWVNMPSGQEKAAYLQAHPEIGDWIRLGPMSNMPEDYRDVVRDIMQQYGDWTQAANDPLSKTISEFYNTPGYARDAFLEKHPELQAYWSYTRTPEQQAMFDLQDQYFKIQDVGEKQAFLGMHPELQQHFVEARTKRYERFLNQVAMYMGANPAMFQDYLNRQQDTLTELIRKFAEPNLIREASVQSVALGLTGEGGRTRRAAQPGPRPAA